ncbi:uncharacterized protein LOC127130926 [Lathyrus oleraceus]|uniref:uncharacterized protein LOC127130926 n=1 Tax=Pisum sativum TaxID=3888 RepID=UPI0021D2759A|nr:uncharacterized protein LOC127130926 [Pisum sativum]
MVHPDIFPKATVRMNVKPDQVNDDVNLDEVNDYVNPDEVNDDVKSGGRPVIVEVDVREQMIQWTRMETEKLGFVIVIRRYDNDFNKSQAFVTMRCVRSDMYQPLLRRLKRDDNGSSKCECLFKLREYRKTNDTWKFNVVSSIHNHVLCQKLVGHPIVCRLISDEKELVSDMTLNMAAPKNHTCNFETKNTSKCFKYQTCIQCVCRNNKAIRCPRSKMQQLFELLEDDHYVSRYKVCKDKVIIQDIF